MSAKGHYELVLLLTHIDPALLRLALAEANGGHVPAGVEGVGIASFHAAAAQCVVLRTAPAGQPWPFVMERVKALRSRATASAEVDEAEGALRLLEDWRAAIARHVAAECLPAATLATLRQAFLGAVDKSRERLAGILTGLSLAVTPDFQMWEVLAILAGRALRGEMGDGHAHVPLDTASTRNLHHQYMSATAPRDAVWREAWRRQAALLDLPLTDGGELGLSALGQEAPEVVTRTVPEGAVPLRSRAARRQSRTSSR